MDSCITSPRCPVIVNCFPPRILLASMKTMSPPTGVQTKPDRNARLLHALFDFLFEAELRNAEHFANHFGRDDELVRLAFGQCAAPVCARAWRFRVRGCARPLPACSGGSGRAAPRR